MPQITVVSMIVEGRLGDWTAFPLLCPLGLMNLGHLFMSGQFSLLFLNILQEQNLLFQVHFDSYFLGTSWFLDLTGMEPHFQEHCSLGTFWSLKLLEAKYRIMRTWQQNSKCKVAQMYILLLLSAC